MNQPSLLERLAKAPVVADPDRAAARLADLRDRLREDPACGALVAPLEDGPLRQLLLAIADHSPFLWRLALADPARLAWLAATAPDAAARSLAESQADLFRRLRAGDIARDEV